jgi:heme-degrading monooxygenase HmoA
VIARHWRGWSTPELAPAYEEHLRTQTFPALRAIDGHADAFFLRRDDGDEVELLVITLWESLDAIRAFAGDDYERAVVPPEAQRLLTRFDGRVTHYDVAARRPSSSAPSTPARSPSAGRTT